MVASFESQSVSIDQLPRGGAVYVSGTIHLPSSSITREAIAIQKQGVLTDCYMFVEILKSCSMEK